MKVSSIVAGIAIFASGVASAPLSMIAPPQKAPVAFLGPPVMASPPKPQRIVCEMPQQRILEEETLPVMGPAIEPQQDMETE